MEGCGGALPDSLAVSVDGERLFFVGAGEVIKVDTRTDEYLGRQQK